MLFSRIRKLLLCLAPIVLGIILGVAVVNIITARKIEQLYLEKAALLVKVKEQEKKLENLSKSLMKQQTRIIKNIHVISNLKDQHKKIRLQEIINELLENVLGQDLNRVDPMLIYKILDNRIISLKEEFFLMKVDIIVMDTDLEVFLTLKPKSLKLEE